MAEFSKVLDVSNLNIPDNGVLVIWDFILPSSGNDSDENSSYSNVVIPEEHSDPEAEESCHTRHTVTFKLIGCTKEARYQRVLQEARDLLEQGNYVPVGLFPEPTNPVDPEAVAFQLSLNTCITSPGIQSSLRTKDTLGTGILSSFRRLSLSRRLAIV